MNLLRGRLARPRRARDFRLSTANCQALTLLRSSDMAPTGSVLSLSGKQKPRFPWHPAVRSTGLANLLDTREIDLAAQAGRQLVFSIG